MSQLSRLVVPSSPRVLVIGLDGATYDVLGPLAQLGVLPNLAALLGRAALVQCRSTQPAITPVAWTTFLTGCEPAEHGILDYRYLDAASGVLRLNQANRVRVPNLFDAVGQSGDVVSINLPMTYPPPRDLPGMIVGGLDSPSTEAVLAPYPEFARRLRGSGVWYGLDTIWKRKPESFEELSRGVALTQADFRGRLTAARIADAMHDWRLLVVQFQTLDSLQHRCWNLLGLEGACGGSPRWTARLREALTTLDECVGELCNLAARRRAAVVVVSDHGFGPFREKISLAELLRKRDLIVPADAPRHALHWLVRKAWRAHRSMAPRLHPGRSAAGAERPLGSLAPIDWRTSRAVALHGNLAALVYLNTAARFGAGPIVSADQYDATLAETIAAFAEARHPETGEALFVHVEATRRQLGCDPLERSWPDVVAIPADGFHTRPKFDRAWRLMVPDTKLTGTHRTSGVLMIDAPGVQLGHTHSAELRNVAPTILAMLGGRPPTSMTGRVLDELWTGDGSPAPSRAERPVTPARAAEFASVTNHPLSAAQQGAVESRLRDLGYIE